MDKVCEAREAREAREYMLVIPPQERRRPENWQDELAEYKRAAQQRLLARVDALEARIARLESGLLESGLAALKEAR